MDSSYTKNSPLQVYLIPLNVYAISVSFPVGSMLGLGVVAYHFSRILAPTSASYIVTIAGFSVFGYFCSAVTTVGMAIIWLYQ